MIDENGDYYGAAEIPLISRNLGIVHLFTAKLQVLLKYMMGKTTASLFKLHYKAEEKSFMDVCISVCLMLNASKKFQVGLQRQDFSKKQ